MDPFDRFLRRPLDEMLVSQSVLTRDKADSLLDSALAAAEPFAKAVLDAGTLTSWDLARLIAIHYQIPVQPLAGYKFEKELFAGITPETLHRHQVVPLAIFGKTRTFGILEPPTRDMLDALSASCGSSLFFFASEGPEIARVLRDHAPVVDVATDRGWHKLFDSADEQVAKGLRNGN
jgi:hypothetical protein